MPHRCYMFHAELSVRAADIFSAYGTSDVMRRRCVLLEL